MTDSWTDPASLQGDALTQWYLRSPADVERQRQTAAAQRYQHFFHGGSGNDPEWAHLKPDADPNRLANLWGLRREAHAIATREWAGFTKSLEGRLPSQAELMEAKLRIDRLVEPYIRRAGLPRSNRLPGKGGPL